MHLNDLKVIRGGRREKMSIYELVVGDIVPLKIGDQVSMIISVLSLSFSKMDLIHWVFFQVPADGILIIGHSLAIDESSMTGESKIVSWFLLLCLGQLIN